MHAVSVFRVCRDAGGLDRQSTDTPVGYCITSQTADRADPARPAVLVRGHWDIGTWLYWDRDATHREGYRWPNRPSLAPSRRRTRLGPEDHHG